MHVLRARNPHCALPEGIYEILTAGIPSPSRYGDVLVYPTPVTTVYSHPTERVVFWKQRDCNPFFHLMEGLWMLAGRNDVGFLEQFLPRMKEFSDDGQRLHGAYGFRWRNEFGIDQLNEIVELLDRYPSSRRAVLQMWDCMQDLYPNEDPKDIPCNTQVYFWRQGGRLNMTVTCRSNDIIWGLYGANAVHFSMLMEYMAARLRTEVGTYYHVSNNFHAYKNTLEPLRSLQQEAASWPGSLSLCPYESGSAVPYPLVADPDAFDAEVRHFIAHPEDQLNYKNTFFPNVARPMYIAHKLWKDKCVSVEARGLSAWAALGECFADDWRLAARQWVDRRVEKAREKAA